MCAGVPPSLSGHKAHLVPLSLFVNEPINFSLSDLLTPPTPYLLPMPTWGYGTQTWGLQVLRKEKSAFGSRQLSADPRGRNMLQIPGGSECPQSSLSPKTRGCCKEGVAGISRCWPPPKEASPGWRPWPSLDFGDSQAGQQTATHRSKSPTKQCQEAKCRRHGQCSLEVRKLGSTEQQRKPKLRDGSNSHGATSSHHQWVVKSGFTPDRTGPQPLCFLSTPWQLWNQL